MSMNKFLALTTGVLTVVVVGLVLALVSGAFGRGADLPVGAATVAIAATGTQPAGVVAEAPSEGVKLSMLSAPNTGTIPQPAPDAIFNLDSFPSEATAYVQGPVNRAPDISLDPGYAEAITGKRLDRLDARQIQRESVGGTAEGIEVHGHWVIEVRDVDGTLADRREFDNELQRRGSELLAAFLAREGTVGGWEVVLEGVPELGIPGGVNPPCVSRNETPKSCTVSEFYTPALRNLSVSNPDGTTLLSGSVAAGQDGVIARVKTILAICDPGVVWDPAEPYGQDCFLFNFSSSDVSPPVPVSEGQIIQVRVTFAFPFGE